MSGFSTPEPAAQHEIAPNATIRERLKCPGCGEFNKIAPTRLPEETLAFELTCETCGPWGVFSPPLKQWATVTPQGAAEIIQRWLLQRHLADAVPGGVDDKDKIIEELRAELAKCANMVHQAYHRESTVGWAECPTGVCQRVRHTLGFPGA